MARKTSWVALVFAFLLVLALGVTVGIVWPRPVPPQPDPSGRLVTHLRLYAAHELFNSTVLASPSATATLTTWCSDHKLAEPAQIVAQPVPDASNPVNAEQRALLEVDAQEPIEYRNVRLRCGDQVLSVAENWYVPSRLTEQMRRELKETTKPFGQVIAPLNPSRSTLSAISVWAVLPHQWELKSSAELREYALGNSQEIDYQADRTILVHNAVVRRGADRLPVSLVKENYKQALLAYENR